MAAMPLGSIGVSGRTSLASELNAMSATACSAVRPATKALAACVVISRMVRPVLSLPTLAAALMLPETSTISTPYLETLIVDLIL